jgi:lysophospholipid acyltransferase (LPLAT)-like uncharacterized protein
VALELDKVYKFGPLSAYKFKDRLLIRAADLAFYFAIRVIGATIRYRTEGWEHFEHVEKEDRIPIYTFWHDRIFAGTYFFRNSGIVVMSSISKDGEYTSRVIKRLGYGSIRGSSTRGGVGALVEMIRLMRSGIPMAFSPDGPRGPRYVAKSGPVMLAKKTGNPIVPFVVECRSYWTIGSWDRMQIPKPFTRANVIVNPPIYVEPEASDEEIEQKLAELQRSLDELVEKGRAWREGE